MATYSYKTPAGTFWISPQPDSPGRVQLGVDDTVLGSYDSAGAAADDFSGGHTGWAEWDRRSHRDAPTDLSEWTYRSP
jgi:hypothetical protein